VKRCSGRLRRGRRTSPRAAAGVAATCVLVAAGILSGWNGPAIGAPTAGNGSLAGRGAALVLTADSGTVTTPTPPAAPTGVSGTVGPGRSYVSFTDSDPTVTSFTVTAWSGGTAVSTASGSTSPILVWGLTYGATYRFTVTATNTAGTSAPSALSASVAPTGPVTSSAVVAPGRTFVNQSTSFTSSAGTNSSRRPQASESASTSLFSPASQGVPAGMEWRILWLRARNCEPGTRKIEFFIQQESPTATIVSKFVQSDTWAPGQPNRNVAVDVAGNGGELAWVDSPANSLIISASQSVGARFYGMTGGSSGCSWQFGAIQQPAGVGVSTTSVSLPNTTLSGSFKGGLSGIRASWRVVPQGSYWEPESVTATNCETSGARHMEVVLLGPGNITQGVVIPTATGSGPLSVPAGGTFSWSAAPNRPRLLLPEGWALGVRWTDMAGDAPTATCAWSATVSVGSMNWAADVFDRTMR
jgi:hypothetical protein